MYECLLIALVGAIINMIFALLIPSLLKNTQQPIFVNIKKVYDTHKQVIITSSVIVFITIYLALKITPELGFDSDEDLVNRDDSNSIQFMFDNNNKGVSNLASLLTRRS